MTKIRRPILIVGNLVLVLLGIGMLLSGFAILESSNLVLKHHAPREEVQAKVYQMTDVNKLQALAANQYEYLDNLATMLEGIRDLAFFSSGVVLVGSLLNFVLIPWRLGKREPKAADEAALRVF